MPSPTPDVRPTCIQCGKPVDPRGAAEDRYCFDTCKWPNGGCGERIYFGLSTQENKQPFNLTDGKPHHLTCKPFLESRKDPERFCPRCQGARRKGGNCPHCGWRTDDHQPRDWAGVEWNGKVRGFYNHRTRVYHRLVRDEHYAYVPRGFGIQDEIVQKLKAVGCEWVLFEWHKKDGSIEDLVCGLDWFATADPTILNPSDGSQRFVRLDLFRRNMIRGKPTKGQTMLADWF